MQSTNALMQKMEGVRVAAAPSCPCEQILCHEALEFLATLSRSFEQRRRDLLQRRVEQQQKLDKGHKLDFLEHTRSIREGNWRVPHNPGLRASLMEVYHASFTKRMGETTNGTEE